MPCYVLKKGGKSYVFKRRKIKYYKDTVVTKYWKEVTTGGKTLEYACYTYTSNGIKLYYYAKAPIGSDMTAYVRDTGYTMGGKVNSSSEFDLTSHSFTSLTESTANAPTLFTATLSRSTADDLYKDTTTTTVVAGTASDYTYTTQETTTVEVTANDAYDRAVVDSEPCYFPMQPSNWKPKYVNYTLPTMTSRTAPEGVVDTNISNGEYTIDAYNFFFNREWYFEAQGREGSRYNRYTFPLPLKPDNYTISFWGNLQSQDRNSGTLSVWYTDGSSEALISYTLTTTRQTFSKTFTTTKPIATISIDMTVSKNDHKNDVTHFGGLNIVSNTGQLQTYVGYEKA